jgi:hypothetical protein
MTIYFIMDWMVDYIENETNRTISNLDDTNHTTHI